MGTKEIAKLLWNHRWPSNVESFSQIAQKCGTITKIHTKYYGKPSGTIVVLLVNVESFSQNIEIGSNLWNQFPNTYLILWRTKWNQCDSTCGSNVVPRTCGTNMVPHVE